MENNNNNRELAGLWTLLSWWTKQSTPPQKTPPNKTNNKNKQKNKTKERQVLRPYQRTNNVMEYESDDDTNYDWCTRNSPQRLGKGGQEELEIGGRAETIQITALLRSPEY